jgi:hypothetical protein
VNFRHRSLRGLINSLSGAKTSSSIPSGVDKPGWTRVDFILDSGASDSAIPPNLLEDHPLLENQGYDSYSCANGTVVPNHGQRSVNLKLQSGEQMSARLSVTEIVRPLLSLGRCIRAGNTIVLKENGSYLQTKQGKKTPVYWRDGVLKIPVWVSPPKPKGFRGQGQKSL